MPSAAYNAIDAVFGRLYHVPSPDRPRTRPLQVICVGPSRSGTDSLKKALLELGYPKVFHGYECALPEYRHLKCVLSKLLQKKYNSGSKDGNISITAEEFDELFGDFDAITDFPGATFAAELAAAYPDAKVILNRRSDVDAWYRSLEAVTAPRANDWWYWTCSWFSLDLYWSNRVMIREVLPFFFRGDFQANGKWVYREHCAMARGLVPKERFLEWGVEDGWEPLCAFLGKEVPKTEFPNGNTPAAFWKFIAPINAQYKRDAYRKMALTAVFVAALGSVVVFRKEALRSVATFGQAWFQRTPA